MSGDRWRKLIDSLVPEDSMAKMTGPLSIDEPPCKHCKYWKPRIKQNSWGPSIECCGQEKYNDFSCFREKEKPSEFELCGEPCGLPINHSGPHMAPVLTTFPIDVGEYSVPLHPGWKIDPDPAP